MNRVRVGSAVLFLLSIVSCSFVDDSPAFLSDQKYILCYEIVSPHVVGVFSGNAILVNLPSGTPLGMLVAKFTVSPHATVAVNSIVQVSGLTENDFSQQVHYTVTAQDGSEAYYTVTASLLPSTSSAISSFDFGLPDSTTEIDGMSITVRVPLLTDPKRLIARFRTDGASVSVGSSIQESGVTENDFTSPVEYVVTAENGSKRRYSVSVVKGNWRNFLGGEIGNDVIADGSAIYAATRSGLYISRDDGESWTLRNTDDGLGIMDENGDSNNIENGVFVLGDYIAVANQRKLCFSDDAGDTWTNYELNLGSSFCGGTFDVFIYGSTIYSALSIGFAVVPIGSSEMDGFDSNTYFENAYIHGIAIVDEDTFYVCTDDGVIYASSNGGADWAPVLDLPGNNFQGICANSGSIYAVSNTGLFLSTDGGSTWAKYLDGVALESIFVSDSMVCVTEFYGSLLVSIDDFESWISYSREDGIRADWINAAYQRDGRIFLATSNGISIGN